MNNMNFRGSRALVAESGFGTALVAREGVVDASFQGVPLISRYWAIARRRKWFVFGAVVACLVAGLIVTLLMTPQYTSSATIEIQRENDNIVAVEGVEPESSVDMEFYQTQYGLLRAQSLAQRVATDLKLSENQEFFELFGAKEGDTWFVNGRPRADVSSPQQRVRKAGEILLENVAISPARLSRLVDVSFTSPDPELSRRVVTAWTQHFVEATLERRFEATSYARKFLEDRLEQVRRRLEESERLVVAYASRQGIINLPSATPAPGAGAAQSERSIVADDLAALNSELTKATADRVQAESRLQASGGNVDEALRNPAINSMRQRRAELASEYSRLLIQFEPEYPAAQQIATQITQIDQAIEREENRVKSTLQSSYRSSAQREAQLSQRVNALKSDFLDLRRRSIQYNIYQRDVDTNRQLYDGLLQRYKEIGVAGGVGANNISIVDPATVPQNPSSPSLPLNMLIALLAGIVLGSGLALLMEQVDEAIADPTEVEKTLGLPLLGAIPKVEEGNPIDALQSRKSPIAEAFLSVQTSLAFSSDHGVPRTLAVTSTRPGEGKSTTTYAVANSLARTNRRVLLIDADMRSPSVHEMLGLQNERGLSNYLAGEENIASLLQPLSPGFDVLSAGPQPPNAAELLTSSRLRKLIDELEKSYEHILFDAPPVMGLADAPLIGSAVEGMIFVVESHGTRSSMARVSIERLQAAQVRIVGVVLSKFESKRAHYGYGYDYGYGYGEISRAAA